MTSDFGKGAEQDGCPPAATDPSEPPGETGAEVKVDPRIDRLIGRSLQAHYEDIVAAPLPDAILVLLAQLEAKERKA